MKLKDWLNGERGRYAALAAHLAVSRGRVSQMAANGVPKVYMRAVREFSGGEVSLEEMLPDPAERADKEVA